MTLEGTSSRFSWKYSDGLAEYLGEIGKEPAVANFLNNTASKSRPVQSSSSTMASESGESPRAIVSIDRRLLSSSFGVIHRPCSSTNTPSTSSALASHSSDDLSTDSFRSHPVAMATTTTDPYSYFDLVGTEVIFKSDCNDVYLRNEKGVVKKVSNSRIATVRVHSLTSDIRVQCVYLEPVRPSLYDSCKVISGPHSNFLGQIGELVRVKGNNGCVRFLSDKEHITKIPLTDLAKYVKNKSTHVQCHVDATSNRGLHRSSTNAQRPTSITKGHHQVRIFQPPSLSPSLQSPNGHPKNDISTCTSHFYAATPDPVSSSMITSSALRVRDFPLTPDTASSSTASLHNVREFPSIAPPLSSVSSPPSPAAVSLRDVTQSPWNLLYKPPPSYTPSSPSYTPASPSYTPSSPAPFSPLSPAHSSTTTPTNHPSSYGMLSQPLQPLYHQSAWERLSNNSSLFSSVGGTPQHTEDYSNHQQPQKQSFNHFQQQQQNGSTSLTHSRHFGLQNGVHRTSGSNRSSNAALSPLGDLYMYDTQQQHPGQSLSGTSFPNMFLSGSLHDATCSSGTDASSGTPSDCQRHLHQQHYNQNPFSPEMLFVPSSQTLQLNDSTTHVHGGSGLHRLQHMSHPSTGSRPSVIQYPMSGQSQTVSSSTRMTRAQRVLMVARGDGRGVGGANSKRVSNGVFSSSSSSGTSGKKSVGVDPGKVERVVKGVLDRLVQNQRNHLFNNHGESSQDVKTSGVRVSLICPLSQRRMNYPSRGTHCKHHQCFDAEAYIRFNIQRSKVRVKHVNGRPVPPPNRQKWQCPLCHKNTPWQHLYIDKGLMKLVKGTSVTEVELDKEGSWQPVKKTSNEVEVIDLTEDDT